MDEMRRFFGRNVDNVVEFRYFSVAHFLPLVLMGVLIFLIYRFKNRLKGWRHEENLRYIAAFVMLICEMSYFWRLLNADMTSNSYDNLPITICGWACIFGAVMLFTKKKFLFDICYFWVLALSFNALITPVPLEFAGVTRFRYYQYWLEHISIYVAVFYMIFVHGFRPTLKSMIPAASALAVLSAIAIAVNVGLGTSPDGSTSANYLYIARNESTFSIANLLPENLFLRYLIIIMLVATLFFAAYLPYLILDIRNKRKQREKNGE